MDDSLPAVADTYIWVEENDPRRCQSHRAGSQCTYKAMEGSIYCPTHGRNAHLKKINETKAFQYRLGKYEQRHQEFLKDPEIKSLRQEIGVARICLEEIFTKINHEEDNMTTMLLMMPGILKTVEVIRETVIACDKLETKIGMTLDRSQVLLIGQGIIDIISEYITDPDILTSIADRITSLVLNIQPDATSNS